ncbi:MAG: restriction endonuclease subunit S, partial [bacterium]
VDFDPVRAKAEGRDPGLPKPLADLFPDSFVDSELGEIPKGWATGVLDDLADVSSGKRPEVRHSEASEEANVPLWGGNGPMAFVPKALIEHPILLTGRVGTLGVVFRITTPCWPSDNTLIVRTKNEAAFEYLFFQLRQIDFNSLNRGSTQPLLTQTDLKVQPLVLPPLELLAHFHAATGDLYRRVDESHAESCTLAALRDALLPKLISGELRVKGAERIVSEGVA